MTPKLAYRLAAFSLALLPALAQAPGLADVNAQLRRRKPRIRS